MSNEHLATIEAAARHEQREKQEREALRREHKLASLISYDANTAVERQRAQRRAKLLARNIRRTEQAKRKLDAKDKHRTRSEPEEKAYALNVKKLEGLRKMQALLTGFLADTQKAHTAHVEKWRGPGYSNEWNTLALPPSGSLFGIPDNLRSSVVHGNDPAIPSVPISVTPFGVNADPPVFPAWSDQRPLNDPPSSGVVLPHLIAWPELRQVEEAIKHIDVTGLAPGARVFDVSEGSDE